MYKLGLDIGVTSVGWGIIDDNYNIIDSGVRLFAERNKDSNVDRRTFRSSRRRLRRLKHRLTRMKNLLSQSFALSLDNMISAKNPYELRVKGLSEQLSLEEFSQAILHLTKRRGTHFLTPEDFQSEKPGEKTAAEIISEQENAMQNEYICQLQYKTFLTKNKVRGIENRHRNKNYLKELAKLLDIQSMFYPEVVKIRSAIEIIYNSKREYYQGPGSKKSPSPYGQYRYNKDGQVEKVNLIDMMRGTCTYYPEEKRIAKHSYTACLFNLLNDLNNLSLNNERITAEQKQELISNYIDQGQNINLINIAKVTGIKRESISGYRIDKSDKPLFTEFKGYKNILKELKNNNLPADFIIGNIKLVDAIMEILTKEKDVEKIKQDLVKQLYLDIDTAAVISKVSGISEYHSLSAKAIQNILPDLWATSKNQMQLFSEAGMVVAKDQKLAGDKISMDIENWVVSPVVKRSVHETIKVINALRDFLRKKHSTEFAEIVIEMAREKNTEDRKDFEKKMQKDNEVKNNTIRALIENQKISGEDFNKFRLLIEQQYKCAYSLQAITPADILAGKTEIDHIIPLSLSFDDSQANKVLVFVRENQNKGQRTPQQYLKSGAGKATFEEFRTWVGATFPNNQRKRANLLYDGDPQKDLSGFIHRNLVDTRYASREILNLLQGYFKTNNLSTKVSVINGSFTSFFRKKAKLSKNRNETFAHHAQDALIVAGLSNSNLIKKVTQFMDKYNSPSKNNYVIVEGKIIDTITGEIITAVENSDFGIGDYIMFIKKVERLKPKFSHKVDRKPNRELYDQNIKATRIKDGERYIVTKYKDIYGSTAGADLKKKILEAPKDLLMYQHDRKTFDKLKAVVDFYHAAKNPFAEYYKEHNEKITKYAKANKTAPAIDNVKWLQKKLGNHRPVKNVDSKNLPVFLSIKTLRADIYWDKNKYTFVGVPYDFIVEQYDRKTNKKSYSINMQKYQTAKDVKGLTENAKFLFSLHKGEFLSYLDKNNNYLEWYYSSINNDSKNVVEVKEINKPTTKQETKTIGKDLKNLTKYHVDILGNRYPITSEKFKASDL